MQAIPMLSVGLTLPAWVDSQRIPRRPRILWSRQGSIPSTQFLVLMMSNRRLKVRGWLAIITGISLSCTLIILMAIPGLNPMTALANYLGDQLATIPEDEVGPQLRRLGTLGDPSIPVLVRAMASEREVVAETAVLVIRENLNAWQSLPTDRSSKKVAILAEHLALQADSFGPSGRIAAGNLITEILIWPVDRKAIDNHQLIVNCEVVLRLPVEEPVASVASLEDANPIKIQAGRPNGIGQSDSPTADLPAEIIKTPSLPSTGLPEVPDTTDGRPEYPFEVPAPRQLVPLNEQPLEIPTDLPPIPTDAARADTPTGTTQLATLDHVSVMKYLRSPDEQTAQAAVTELQGRGFRDSDISLATRLVHPDPVVRIELARNLPRISGVDSRRWLVWLSEDAAASVRSEAVSILATSRDPAIQKHLRELARRESDPDVLQHLR